MATIQATNILTGTTEGPKWNATGDTTELWTAATTTALALNDIISGPVIPANTYLNSLQVAFTDIDSATSFTFTAGYVGQTAAFITTSTVGQAQGVATINVALAIGFTATTDTTVLITVTATAGTPVAGTCRIRASYTASP
jgi:hypothetical protein